LDSEFYLLEKRLSLSGYGRQPSEPIGRWLRRVLDESPPDLRPELQRVVQLHYRYRFDPLGITQPDRESLRAIAVACLERIG
jgi:hypothetical protein